MSAPRLLFPAVRCLPSGVCCLLCRGGCCAVTWMDGGGRLAAWSAVCRLPSALPLQELLDVRLHDALSLLRTRQDDGVGIRGEGGVGFILR